MIGLAGGPIYVVPSTRVEPVGTLGDSIVAHLGVASFVIYAPPSSSYCWQSRTRIPVVGLLMVRRLGPRLRLVNLQVCLFASREGNQSTTAGPALPDRSGYHGSENLALCNI